MAGLSGVEQRIRAILHPCLKRTPVPRRIGQVLAVGTLAVVVAISLMLPSTSQEASAGQQTGDGPVPVSSDADTAQNSNGKVSKKTNNEGNNKTSKRQTKKPNESPAATAERLRHGDRCQDRDAHQWLSGGTGHLLSSGLSLRESPRRD